MNTSASLQKISDRTLRRITIGAGLALLIAIPLVAAFYWFDRHPSSGPSLNDRAVAAAEEAVRTTPNDIGARNHLAAAYVSAGRYDDGIAQFGQVLAAAPADRAALLGRGLAYLAQGTHDPAKLDNAKLDLATADFQALVAAAKDSEFAKTDPQLEQAYYEIGFIALKQGRAADAVTSLIAALAINGGDADALYSFGVALIQTGDPTKGVAALRHAVQFVPTGWCDPYHGLQDGYAALKDSVGSQWATGMTAMCEGNLDAAATALQPLTSGTMKVDALLGLALVAQSRGDNPAAADLYRQVLAVDPKNTSASIGLGQLGLTGSPAPQGTPR